MGVTVGCTGGRTVDGGPYHRAMRHPLIFAVAVLVALPAIAAAEKDLPLDVTKHGIMYRVPGMDAVKVRRDLTLAGAPKIDLYMPAKARGRLPVVVFANGVGDPPGSKVKSWKIYEDWARLIAARGYAAVLHEADASRPRQEIAGVLEALSAQGASLGLDAGRIAVWACSGNVHHALPLLMDDAPRGVRAAVIYYGAGSAKALRKDLPVFWVLAGQDGPGLIAGQRALWKRAIDEGAPWTMRDEPGLPHAFDGLDTSEASRRAVAATLAFFDEHLGTLPPPPPPSAARDILADLYGQRFAEAVKKLEPRAAAHPEDADTQNALANAYRQSGRPAEAVALYRRLHTAQPDNVFVARNLVISASAASDCKTAAPVAAAIGDRVKDPPYLTARATCELLDGNREAAEKTIAAVVASGSNAGVLHYNLACALALAGRRDDALTHLERSVAAGWNNAAHTAADSDLASLRETPRFKAVMAKLQAAAAAK
jgi:tetratricopeptide (TPR) repeat protein